MGKLREALDEMTRIQRALGEAALVARKDPSRKQAVIDLRRQFSQALVRMSAAADEDEQLKDNADLAREFRQRLSEMRSNVAVFQAKWPAVLLSSEDPEFERTAQALRASNREFTDWAQRVIR